MVVRRPPDDAPDHVFHALADPTRRDILRVVTHEGASVSRLAERYPMSFAAVQKHVAVLERAGLVCKERRGREQIVHARVDAIRTARLLLQDLEELWRARIGQFGEVLAETTESESR